MRDKFWGCLLFLVLLPMVFGLSTEAGAAQNVKGRYLGKVGAEISIELEISAPPPPLVIVLQSLPAGVQVVEARPESKLADPGQGQVKWLLSGLTVGKHRLELKLDRPAAAEAGGGEIRYRNPADGKMVVVAISDRAQ